MAVVSDLQILGLFVYALKGFTPLESSTLSNGVNITNKDILNKFIELTPLELHACIVPRV
jgi:hypothetical protein